jgi:hypothetical protein
MAASVALDILGRPMAFSRLHCVPGAAYRPLAPPRGARGTGSWPVQTWRTNRQRIRLDIAEVAVGGGIVPPWLRHGAAAHNASSLATRGVTEFHPPGSSR